MLRTVRPKFSDQKPSAQTTYVESEQSKLSKNRYQAHQSGDSHSESKQGSQIPSV